jgi:hypothetical protein
LHGQRPKPYTEGGGAPARCAIATANAIAWKPVEGKACPASCHSYNRRDQRLVTATAEASFETSTSSILRPDHAPPIVVTIAVVSAGGLSLRRLESRSPPSHAMRTSVR